MLAIVKGDKVKLAKPESITGIDLDDSKIYTIEYIDHLVQLVKFKEEPRATWSFRKSWIELVESIMSWKDIHEAANIHPSITKKVEEKFREVGSEELQAIAITIMKMVEEREDSEKQKS